MHHTAASITLRRRRPSRRPHGFTVLELMVVVGIALALMAMILIGFRGLGEGGRRDQTKITLRVAQNMLAEYEMRNPLNTIQTVKIDLTAATTYPNVDLDADDDGDGVHNRQDADNPIIANTSSALNRLKAVPANRDALNQLNERQQLQPQGPTRPLPTSPMLADAWGNPIIYVPADGLRNVDLGDPPAARHVTSTKVYDAGVIAMTDAPAPNARPFFASAGPDGNFRKGDDNIYSFEN